MLHQLLALGFFPRELPPQFTTAKYAARLAGPGAAPPNTRPPGKSLCADHSLPRVGALRRHLRIPNPIHFYELSKHLCDHWPELKAAAHRSPYSLTKPILAGERAINLSHSLRDRVTHRARIRADGRFVARADITRFYPSVYTHSFPWALLGKDEAKRQFDQKVLRNHWSDTLDRLVRRLNGDQTVGIPVGPDTSFLLAEVLLSNVDAEVSRKHPDVRGLRYVDDYEFVTQTRAEAEAVLSTLQGALRTIELELNASKTSIEELPVALTDTWAATLRRHPIDDSRSFAQHEDLSGFFGVIFQTMRDFPEDPVLKYGLGRLSRMEIHPGNWPFFEHLLQQCVTVEPACLPQVGADVEYYRQTGLPLNSTWPELLNRTIASQLQVGNASEAAWAMSLLLQFGLPMNSDAAKAAAASGDSIVALLAAILANAALTEWSHLQNLQRYVGAQHLYQPQWLFTYEASVWQWFGGHVGLIAQDEWFHHLYGAGTDVTTFLQPGARILPPRKVISRDGHIIVGGDANDDDDDDLFEFY